MKNQIKFLIAAVLCVMGMTACQDDLIGQGSGADGKSPVHVNLSFALPQSSEIAVTRADNSLSRINNGIQLFIFDGNEFMSSQYIPQSNLTTTGTDDTGRHYTADNVTLYRGTQTVYAVANLSGTAYFEENSTEIIAELETAAAHGEEAFLSTLYTLNTRYRDNNACPSFSTTYVPLSGVGTVTVSGNTVSGIITMKRLVAQVKFVVKTSYSSRNKTVTFTPSTYAFHNIPIQAYILGGTGQARLTGETVYYDADAVTTGVIGEDGTVEFSCFVPESLLDAKNSGTGIHDYYDRDKFTGTGNAKNWINAPDNGMYVVLSGQCAETQNGSLVKSGQVEYTIHLGDFSNRQYDNFSIERNTIYTYTVSVEGMEQIKVEAQTDQLDGGDNPGAEGDVIELTTASKMFNLDAHYEQVYVEYNLSDIADNIVMGEGTDDNDLKDRIARNFILSIHTPLNTRAVTEELVTPYNSTSTEEEGMAGIDYKWVEFYSQERKTVQYKVSAYPGRNSPSLLSPWEVCQKLGDAVYKIKKGENPSGSGLVISQSGGDYYAAFTIFIDEYFYQKDLAGNVVAWETYANAEPRTLLIASAMAISEDLNSTYSTALTYLSQRAMETFYNSEASSYYNAMGIEVYNENGTITGFGTPHSRFDRSDNTDESMGRDNTLINICGTVNINSQRVDWSDFIDWTHIGYTDSNTGEDGNIPGYYNSNSAVWACLSRNRDLNGNTKIDDDEVRWYLPALSQYLRMGIGYRALSEDARPYTGIKSRITSAQYETEPLPIDLVNDGALYYMSNVTNGNTNFGYYWAVEVGSYGSPNASTRAQVRCVRNLPSKRLVPENGDNEPPVGRDAWAGPVYDRLKTLRSGNKMFEFGDRLIPALFRLSSATDPMEGSYAEHTEEDDINNLPQGFVVSEDYISRSETYSMDDVCDPDKDPCATYSERHDESDKGYWRTPNLNELMVMSTQADALNLAGYDYGAETSLTVCSTKFSNSRVRKHFYFNGNFVTTSNAGTRGIVRCVRDATQAELDQQ